MLFEEVLNNDENINDILLNKQKLKEITIKNYFYSFKYIKRLLKEDYEIKDLKINLDIIYNNIVNIVSTIVNVNSRKITISNFIKILATYNLIINNEDLLLLIIKLERSFTKFYVKKEKKIIIKKKFDTNFNYDNIIKNKEENYKTNFYDLNKKDLQNDIKFLILSCFLSFYPLKNNDFMLIKIYNSIEEKTENDTHYIIMNEQKLYIIEKNKKRIINLPLDFYSIVKFFYEKYNYKYLLPKIKDPTNNHLSSEQITIILSALLKIKTPLQTLRQLYLQKLRNENHTQEELKEIFKILGISPSKYLKAYEQIL